MSRFLYLQCLNSNIIYPRWAKRWINIRKVFCNAYHVQRAGVSTMLEILGLKFEGHPHSGVDDARNIARILAQLIADGCNLYENERISLSSATRDSSQPADVAVVDSNTVDNSDDDDVETDAAADSVSQRKTECANDSDKLNSEPVLAAGPEDDDDDDGLVECTVSLKQLSV